MKGKRVMGWIESFHGTLILGRKNEKTGNENVP
jgi:hypothetical protein